MQKRTGIIFGASLVASVATGLAFATPPAGVDYNVVLSTGVAEEDLQAHGHVAIPSLEEDFGAVVATDGASNIVQQEIKFAPGGTTGWHTHPGVVILTLAADSGPVNWYDSKCGKRVYSAGDSWTEGTKVHDVVNAGSIDAHFLVTYIVAKDVLKRTDHTAPKCAVALGLQ